MRRRKDPRPHDKLRRPRKPAPNSGKSADLFCSGKSQCNLDGLRSGNGAQGRDRTTDTAIFSRMLYQLSYLGILEDPKALASGRFIERSDAPVHPASPSASLGAARLRTHPQITGKSRLFGVFGIGIVAGDDVLAG